MPSSQLPRIPDAVAHQIETRILEGSLKPGDRLPAERELAIELGVSRPSLREAIKKLVSRDLLDQPSWWRHFRHRPARKPVFRIPGSNSSSNTPACRRMCSNFAI
jgi:DNA-binding transcriptional MocR family regulator